MKLQLKNRPIDGTGVSLNMNFVLGVLESRDANVLFNALEEIVQDRRVMRHDYEWLRLIVNWQKDPRRPVPLMQQAEWIEIAARVNKLDHTCEHINLTPEEFYMLKKRVYDPDFSFVSADGSPVPLTAFVDFWSDLKYQFEEMEAKLDNYTE